MDNPTKVAELIAKLSKLHENCVREELAKQSLRVSYRSLLSPLADKDGVTQLDLVRITGLKPPTVSTTLRVMEHHGYVERVGDDNDARIIRVNLTEKGRKANEQMRTATTKLDTRFFSVYSDEELEQLYSLLNIFIERTK
ncbi:MAG: MarR family transcriptional regulator [Oscillospiraceae bacterium]|jgi:DNA-binding MarR family transcriptional regulator|nr:MarR family transcriptional regulator [Oscillospiraceae bacterium]